MTNYGRLDYQQSLVFSPFSTISIYKRLPLLDKILGHVDYHGNASCIKYYDFSSLPQTILHVIKVTSQ